MDSPANLSLVRSPKSTRRLIVFDQESDSELIDIARHFFMSHSEVVRMALKMAAERLRENPPTLPESLISNATEAVAKGDLGLKVESQE